MARLFTNAPQSSPELEIEIDNQENCVDEENQMTTTKQRKTTATTLSSSSSSSSGFSRKKLTDTWMKLTKLPPQELVTELKSVHDYLSPMDQDHVDRSELLGLAEQLASPSLVKHKDRAVRVLVACCIANVLRLFAPDAPYSMDQFETIFNLFLHQLKGVAEPEGVYYNYHYFLLESLSTVKSVVLIFDLPQADVLQREIIQMALDMMHPSLLKNVRLYLLELVQTLLEECDQVPVEVISDQLAPALLNGTHNELARSFVQDLIRQCAEKLQGPLAIHFSDMLARVARGQESESTLTKVTHEAHEFAVQVSKLSLSASSSILGLLEEELKVESVEIRQASIHSLAQIFSHHQNRLSNMQSLWTSWLGRRNDKAPRCRISWVRGASEIVSTSVRSGSSNWALCEQLMPMLAERLQDPDEKVRLMTIQNVAMELQPLARTLQEYSTPLLEALTDRCLDRKEDVQSAALTLCSDWLFSLLKFSSSSSSSNDGAMNVLIHKLLQLTFSESRIHSLAFLGYLERDIFVRLAREFPDLEVRTEKLMSLLKIAFGDERSHSAYRALLRHKNQFLKAWTALLKLSRMPSSSLTDIHRAKTIQVCQFLAERMPGVSELDAQRALLAFPSLSQSSGDATLLQMLIDLAEVRVSSCAASAAPSAFNLLARIDAHLKAATSISAAVKKVITAALPFGSQISLNTALIGHLTSIDTSNNNSHDNNDNTLSVLLQDLLTEFPQLFENRTTELVTGVLNGATPAAVTALAQYLSNTSSSRSCDRNLLAQLDAILLNLLHPPLGSTDASFTNFDPKSIASAAQILLILKRQSAPELIQDLILQLAQDERVQVKSALAALTGVVKLSGSELVPHFEMIFDLITQRLFPHCPASPPESGKKSKSASAASGGEGELLAGWPGIRKLEPDFQIAVLCSRFLSSLVASLIRQHTRIESAVDLDTISSIRSLSVGFFLTRLQEDCKNNSKNNSAEKRLQYSLLKGLLTCLPDASASDLTSHLHPLFLALQDTDQRLRYKLATLLCRLIRNRRLSDAFIPLLFFAGAHESSLLIKSTLKALLGEIIRSWPGDSAVLVELLPLLIVYTVRHPDYSAHVDRIDFSTHRGLLSGYYDYFVDAVVDSKNCGSIYESVSRLKLFHFVPLDEEASYRLYVASEWAQEAIKSKCASHHWPLLKNDDIKSANYNNSKLSLLVPDVLVELDESAQLQNIHRVFSNEFSSSSSSSSKRTETNNISKKFIIKK